MAPPAAAPGATAGPARSPASASLAQEIDRLAASAQPADALAAYRLLAACAHAQRLEFERKLDREHVADVCRDVSAGQLAGRSRPLDRAAAAGEPGALRAFLAETAAQLGRSPVGSPDELADPQIAQYFASLRTYQIAAAGRGDRGAIAALATTAAAGEKGDVAALAYWAALRELAGAEGPADANPYATVVSRMGGTLSAEDRAAALDAGRHYAAALQNAACSSDCQGPAEGDAGVDVLSARDAATLGAASAMGSRAGPGNKSWLPGDVVTFCDPAGCREVRYAAAGMWLKAASAP